MKKPSYSFFNRVFLAFSGIFIAIKRERHMKMHFIFGVALLTPMFFLNISLTHRWILGLLVVNLIIFELINTAIETTVDLITRRFSYRAKLAKDMAAGAVLIAALMVFGFSIFIYWSAMYNL